MGVDLHLEHGHTKWKEQVMSGLKLVTKWLNIGMFSVVF